MHKISSFSLAVLLASFAFTANSFADSKFASMGKYKITQDEAVLATKMAGLGEFDKLSDDAKKMVATRILNDKAIEDKAKKEGIDELVDVEMSTRAILVSKYVEKHSGNLEILAKKKYDETVEALKDKKTYTLYHILVKDAVQANNLKKAAMSAGKYWKSQFKRLAKANSIDTATAINGGFVGAVPETKLPKEFVQNIKDIRINTLTDPFKTNLGYHIVFIEKVEPTHIEPYNNVKNIFIAQIFQEETERLAKENLKEKEVKFENKK